MKITAVCVLALFCLAPLVMASDNQPELVPVALKKVFIPTGFDSNDQIQVVVTGVFPDSCYKPGPYKINNNEAGVSVTQYAYRYKGLCLDMIVPFSQVIELGIKQVANHNLSDAVSGGYLGTLAVTAAKSPAVDDYLYAPVNEAMILEERGGVGPVLYLTGNYPNRFMRIKEVRVIPYDDVLVVQPIAEIIPGDSASMEGEYRPRFEIKKPLKNVPKGAFLLHVRTMNGKAINKVEELSGN